MVRRLFFALPLLIVAGGAAWATEPMRLAQMGPGQGNPQEQAACRRDATRFCRDVMENDARVLSCLQKHRRQISGRCRAVLESHRR